MKKENALYTVIGISIMAILMVVFGFTPLGRINISGFNCTLIGLPVAIIACIYGPYAGLGAGALWGLISSMQGLLYFDEAGVAFFEISPVGSFLTCLLARMLAGFLCGLIYDLVRIYDETGVGSAFAGSAILPIFNGFFFMSGYSLVCMIASATGPVTTSIVGFLFSEDALNLVIEFLVNLIVGSPVIIFMHYIGLKYNLESTIPHFFVSRRKRKKEEIYSE